MGLFDVFRLAGDYAKAKKMLASKKIDIVKASKVIERLKEFIDVLYKYKDELSGLIKDVKELIKKLKEREE